MNLQILYKIKDEVDTALRNVRNEFIKRELKNTLYDYYNMDNLNECIKIYQLHRFMENDVGLTLYIRDYKSDKILERGTMIKDVDVKSMLWNEDINFTNLNDLFTEALTKHNIFRERIWYMLNKVINNYLTEDMKNYKLVNEYNMELILKYNTLEVRNIDNGDTYIHKADITIPNHYQGRYKLEKDLSNIELL